MRVGFECAFVVFVRDIIDAEGTIEGGMVAAGVSDGQAFVSPMSPIVDTMILVGDLPDGVSGVTKKEGVVKDDVSRVHPVNWRKIRDLVLGHTVLDDPVALRFNRAAEDRLFFAFVNEKIEGDGVFCFVLHSYGSAEGVQISLTLFVVMDRVSQESNYPENDDHCGNGGGSCSFALFAFIFFDNISHVRQVLIFAAKVLLFLHICKFLGENFCLAGQNRG